MTGFLATIGKPAKTLSVIAAVTFSISSAAAGATCGLCDTEVVLNSDLAACFLEKYKDLAAQNDQAIVVDLSDCQSRGIVEALPAAGAVADEPDTQFMVSPTQLQCLASKLDDPNLVLDPSAKIDLSSCS